MIPKIAYCDYFSLKFPIVTIFLLKLPIMTGPFYDMTDVEPAMLEQLLQYAYFQNCDILKETGTAVVPLPFTAKNKEQNSFNSSSANPQAAAVFSKR